jgi:hypothetical protein
MSLILGTFGVFLIDSVFSQALGQVYQFVGPEILPRVQGCPQQLDLGTRCTNILSFWAVIGDENDYFHLEKKHCMYNVQ